MRLQFAIPALALCWLCGCGERPSSHVPVHPVSGKLLVGGQPAEHAEVVLYPVGEEGHLLRPHGTVQPDGSFHLTTYATGDGAPVGDFALTVTWPGPRVKGQAEDEAGPDRLLNFYANPKRPAANVRIDATTALLATIDLKPKVQANATNGR